MAPSFAGRDAGETYSKLAEIHVKQDNKADAAQAYVEASKAYQRVDKSSMPTYCLAIAMTHIAMMERDGTSCMPSLSSCMQSSA